MLNDKDTEVNVKTNLLDETKSKSKKIKKDPLVVHEISVNEDFYSLTWNACRKDSYNDQTFNGVKITLTDDNFVNLVFSFFCFISIVLLTISILVYESFASDIYKEATWPIVILRITLIYFAQQKLKPEIFQGIALTRNCFKNPDDYIYPNFATFVALCQAVIALVTFVSIFFFCCMGDEALDLIMNFAGLSVISELDDWVGGQIMADQLYEVDNLDDNNIKIDNENLNERMSLFTKLCIISRNLGSITDDQNKEINNNRLYAFFSKLSDYTPWGLIPFLTLPAQSILMNIQHSHEKSK